MGKMPDIPVHAIVFFLRDRNRDIMGGGKIDGIFTGFDVPFPPRGDDLELRSQRLDAQFKTNLIVALTCSTMADGIGIFLQATSTRCFAMTGRAMDVPRRYFFS